ncbi:MAG: ATP-dependent zinc metalloprotease FtsH [Pseudomonadota bacterium]
MNNWTKNVGVWLVIGIFCLWIFQSLDKSHQQRGFVPYSDFITKVKSQSIVSANIEERTISWKDKQGNTGVTLGPNAFGVPAVVDQLVASGVKVDYRPDEEPSWWKSMLVSSLPMIIFIVLWVVMVRQMNGGGKGGVFSFGKSRARMLDDSANVVTFADVAGCDEAKEEVGEIVDFLRDPHKFQKLGGKIPRGVLMVGSPGTGKTLLAKAIAGEAKVPFYSISGSDFVEMFVGVGAARVRDMFEQAKKSAPCIIFIDEIDAVGRQRGVGLGGGNDEREQTLNQLLVEMDGFEPNSGVIVIAATNRPDVLDQALLRPGRFDRQVTVPLPDIKGRTEILNVHTRKVPLASDVSPEVIARGTTGFSGADLANLVNEAALFAARKNKRLVEMFDFEEARDKIVMGTERRSIVMPEEERRNTAYHESGHALVARLLPKCDPVHKVTVIPRGRALGVTMSLPEEDRYSTDKERILNGISVLFGGRIAEEIFMGQMTTGASNDFQRATQMAHAMVARYGMSDLGTMVYLDDSSNGFLGTNQYGQASGVSGTTQREIEGEVRKILDQQYKIARDLIELHRDKIEAMTQALLKWETITTEDIDNIMAGRPVRGEQLLPSSVNLSKPVAADGSASDGVINLDKTDSISVVAATKPVITSVNQHPATVTTNNDHPVNPSTTPI